MVQTLIIDYYFPFFIFKISSLLKMRKLDDVNLRAG